MKRIYYKPEARTLHLRLNTFIAVSPTGTDYNMEGQGGVGDAGSGSGFKPSRSLRDSMWDDDDDDE